MSDHVSPALVEPVVMLMIWVHSHAETGEPCEVDIHKISGSIEMEFIHWLTSRNQENLLLFFGDLPLDKWWQVPIRVEYSGIHWDMSRSGAAVVA